eukprot:Tamp_16959.p1 GENE.Tamp_16959~~Tamp_16959.p1  ORF type:complete len:435 (+),score=54.17 Tamp_16959:3-1307(+)
MRLVTTALLRRSTAPPAGSLLRHGAVHAQTDGGINAEASAAVVREVRALAADGLLSSGIQVAARVRGRPLVSVWGGCCARTARPVAETSLFHPWSVAKGVASTALCIVAAREGVSFDDRVTRVWPGFARGGGRRGKGDTTIAAAAGYRGGMPEHPPLASQALDAVRGGWRRHWEAGIRWVEEYEPEWEPGARASYHPMSYSWIVGGIVERADGQRRHIRQVVSEDIAKRLGYEGEMFLGCLPPRERSRIVCQTAQVPVVLGLTEEERFQAACDASTMAVVANSRLWSSVCLPSSNGFFSARALAAMYAVFTNGGCVDGQQLLPVAAVEEVLARVASPKLFPATTSRYATKGASGYRDSLGFHPYGHEEPELYGPNCSYIIGCAGAGGSVAFADPVSGLSVAILKADYLESRLGLTVAERILHCIRQHLPRAHCG